MKNRRDKQKTKNKMVDLTLNMYIINLKINELNMAIKRHSFQIRKRVTNIYGLLEFHFKYNNLGRLKRKTTVIYKH